MRGVSINAPIRDENPCHNCKRPNRRTGCHDTCKEHKKWKAEVDRVNANRREYKRKLGNRYK